MAYSDFSVEKVKRELGVKLKYQQNLFGHVPPVAASSWLEQTLRILSPLATNVNTEKARSEFIIAPILGEIANLTQYAVAVISGQDFTVDASQGLTGYCDFMLSRSTEPAPIEAPVFAIVEAKKESLSSVLGQCIAEMVAAQRFNRQNERAIPIVYGAVTTGTSWQFLMLEDQLATIDRGEYYLSQVDWILGILLQSVGQPTETLSDTLGNTLGNTLS
jgi:hypothetical protein